MSNARHKSNKLLQVWLRSDLYEWLVEYLQRVSFGESTADQMRLFFMKLQELDEKQQTLVTPREDRRQELIKENTMYGLEERMICVRQKNRNVGANELVRMCDECKIQVPSAWQGCQSAKKEQREALK